MMTIELFYGNFSNSEEWAVFSIFQKQLVSPHSFSLPVLEI